MKLFRKSKIILFIGLTFIMMLSSCDPSNKESSTSKTTSTSINENFTPYASKEENIAYGKNSYSSSLSSANEVSSANELVDGDITSGVLTHKDDETPYFLVDLENTKNINKITLVWGGTEDGRIVYPLSYTIEIGISQNSLSLVKKIIDGKQGKTIIRFENKDARFVKISVLSKRSYFVKLNEVRVYETEESIMLNEDELKPVRVLFIGNSHTYTNDVPGIVKDLFDSEDREVIYKEITEGGVTLKYHSEKASTIQTIKSNVYDYIVLQEKASGFNPQEFAQGVTALLNIIKDTKAKPILYMIWSNESLPAFQEVITNAYVTQAQANSILLAAAGVSWDIVRHQHKDIRLYVDGNHATKFGSYLAASSIYYALTNRKEPLKILANDPLAKRLSLSKVECELVQSLVSTVTKEGYDVAKLLAYGKGQEDDGSKEINIALNKNAYASSNDRNDSTTPVKINNLTDGNETTFIVTHQFDSTPWFYVDLGTTKFVNKVVLNWGSTYNNSNAYASEYIIQGSDDGDEWNTFATVIEGSFGNKVIRFEPVIYQYFRVYVTKLSGNYALLNEMYIYEPKIEPTVNTFDVSFFDGEVELTELKTKAIANKPMGVPTPPSKPDYSFDGWYNDVELTMPYNFANLVTGNLVLYAKWKLGNLISDSSFQQTTSFAFQNTNVGIWSYNATAKAKKFTPSIIDGKASIDIELRVEDGPAIGTAYIYQSIVGLEFGKQYTLSFIASSTVDRNIGVRILSGNHTGGGTYVVSPVSPTVAKAVIIEGLTSVEKTFTFTFTVTDSNILPTTVIYIVFAMTGQTDPNLITTPHTITLDDVTIN